MASNYAEYYESCFKTAGTVAPIDDNKNRNIIKENIPAPPENKDKIKLKLSRVLQESGRSDGIK